MNASYNTEYAGKFQQHVSIANGDNHITVNHSVSRWHLKA